jgi:hypothetical protein
MGFVGVVVGFVVVAGFVVLGGGVVGFGGFFVMMSDERRCGELRVPWCSPVCPVIPDVERCQGWGCFIGMRTG